MVVWLHPQPCKTGAEVRSGQGKGKGNREGSSSLRATNASANPPCQIPAVVFAVSPRYCLHVSSLTAYFHLPCFPS